MKKKDRTALEKLVGTEVNKMLNEINSTLKEPICYSASRAGALKESNGKTTFTSNTGWFDRECQSKS